MRRNYFQNEINITERLGIRNNNQRLRENNNISFVNINSESNVLNNSLNYQIQFPNRTQINNNMIGQKQNNIINPNEKNKSPIINKRNNAMENINNNFNNNINNSVNYNGNNKVNNNGYNKVNNNVNHNVSNVNNRAGNIGNNKNGKQIQNNFLYLSSYFNKNNDLRNSQSNRTFLSEPIKNNENNPIPKKEEGETKKLIKTMTDLIDVIKTEREDIKAQTEQLYAQNEHLYAQTNQLKVQTDALINQLMADRNESQKQHAKLVSLLIKNLNK